MDIGTSDFNVENRPADAETPQNRGAIKAAEFLRALSNPHRLLLLELLREAPHTVMDLCERLQLRQSLVSQHLARLRLDGVVSAERQGHFVLYSLRDNRVLEILNVLSSPVK